MRTCKLSLGFSSYIKNFDRITKHERYFKRNYSMLQKQTCVLVEAGDSGGVSAVGEVTFVLVSSLVKILLIPKLRGTDLF